mmetsp:Transcript_40860/g.102896  ORF Transcript_40860/g.102896 Transcript_40860/m.102896 type:complete len:118 (-) Transcript_40860:209-562(-)
MQLAESDSPKIPTMLYGSVSGTIGVVASLPQKQFLFYSKVQNRMREVIKGVGGFSHAEWRAFTNERRTSPMKNFIDGDLIECFLDLDADKMAEVVKGLDVTAEELCKSIETLAQALH